MNRLYLTGARVVLPDAVLEDAAVLIEDDVIAAINPESGHGALAVDLRGKTLMPGMIDLHCDALEKEVEPRPNVHFPLDFACAQADKRNAAAGVTTVFHALSFANEELGVRNNAFAAAVARAVHAWNPHGLIDNRVHCRYEVTDPTAPEILLELMAAGEVHLLSVMDHSPGQGQFKDIAAYRDYLARTYKKSAGELDALLENKLAQAEGAMERIRRLIGAAHERGIRVASHDDDTPEKVETLHGLGVGISEFPINLESAQAARERGMSTVFGAPNILRGKSQSGAMRALDAVKAGVADCLCADYHPAALIMAVFRLPELAGISLADAVRLVSTNPARAAGLTDRGEIAVGKRADLVAVAHINGLAQASSVFSAGKLVFEVHFDHG
ncbi:MAG: alpha-D-ribose 1-methylphosphonate 5-triphosphate diphosphatase [Rhodocyclales bacterium]|uniref:alpha-D-ribose 1-methylphosphonate 5-triphosphate diphosphatase n=1 Tax=Tepidiphilus sp. J10 TaxID=2502185 RepID=UPI00115C74B4|nr:alpha-D-ribose 1-methylphosphonate 5-triphosphate diphosphatase [Tepidiphilus sp. J10]MBI5781261.1 alpha-D-ribose 1-methylphosphonate 5-triphosphate diphosphatase [Rhodocyclales bacterium]